MANKDKNTADTKAQQKERMLLRKADSLSNFGTLTSLISTAAYFIEQAFIKTKLRAEVVKATLVSVGVGITTTLASYYYRYKAGRVALLNDKAIAETERKSESEETLAVVQPDITSRQDWTEKQQVAEQQILDKHSR